MLVCSFTTFVLVGTSFAKQIYKFDFGTEKSAVFSDFVGINKDTLYTKTKGYGWHHKAMPKSRVHFDRKIYDDLCCDLVLARSSKFNIDLPYGRYVVNIWLGDLHDLFDYLRFGIKAEGQVIYKPKKVNFDTYKNFYFRNSNLDYKKGDNPWDKYINPRFILKTFPVEVIDGQLNLELKNCRLNAIVVYPLNSASKNKKIIHSIQAKRQQQFKTNWSEVKCIEAILEPTEKYENIKQGYVLFSRHWMEKIYPETIPQKKEACTELNVSCTQGEYEPISFSIYPLDNLKNTRIMVEHLFNREGIKFDSRNIDVKVQRYRIVRARDSWTYSIQPAHITNFYDIDIEQGITRKFLLDIYVPPDTKPGEYKGVIWVKPANKPETKLTLKVKILPFELLLDKDKHNYALQYFVSPHFRPFIKNQNRWESMKKDFVFMKKFGITIPTLGYDNNSWPIISWNSTAKKLNSINLSNIEKTMQVYKDVQGFPASNIIYCMYHMGSRGYYSIHLQRNTSGTPISKQPPEFWTAYTQIVKAIKRKQIENNWPDFIFLVTAEMSNTGLDHIKYGKAIHENLQKIPQIKIAGMPNSWKELQLLAPVSNIISMQYKHCTTEAVQYGKEKTLDHSFWLYQSNNRFTYGFYFHKIGAKGSFKEDFQSVSVDPYNSFDGRWDEVTANVAYALPSPDGPVPLHKCYEYREGIDDAKYLYTLEQYIKKAKTSTNPEVQEQAEHSDKVLKQIFSRINPDLTYYYNEVGFWDNLAYDRLRKQLASEISKLKNLN